MATGTSAGLMGFKGYETLSRLMRPATSRSPMLLGRRLRGDCFAMRRFHGSGM